MRARPGPGTTLDRSHPLSAGLIAAYLVNEGTGSNLTDSASGLVASVATNYQIIWRAGADGMGLASGDSNGDTWTIPNEILGRISDRASLVLGLQRDVNIPSVGGDSGLCGLRDPGGNSNHYPYTDGNIYLGVFSSNRVTLADGGFDKTRPHQLTFTSRPGADGWNCYQDSRLLGSQSGAAVPNLGLPQIGGTSPYFFGGIFRYCYIYNRDLAGAEVAALAADPHAIFTRPSVRRYVSAPQIVGLTGAATWNVRQNVYTNASESWNIRAAVGPSGADAWDVRKSVGTSGLSLWDVRNPVGLNGDSYWDVYVITAPTSYPVGIAGDAAWNVLNSVYVNGFASWDNRISAGLAGSAIWANMIPVGIAGDTTWDMRTPSRIAGNALWHVRGRVGGGWSDRWNNRSGAGLERSASWSLRGLAGLAGSASWDITSLLAHWSVGIGGSLTWADRRRLGFSGMVTWNDRLPRGLTRNVIFNIHIKTGKYSTVDFHARSRLGTTWSASWADRLSERITRQDRWDVRALAGLTAADRWGVRGRVGFARSASWSMRIPVGMSLTGTWRDRARVAMAGACVWDLRARVGSNQHIYWNIRNPVRLTAEASWDLRDVVGVDGDVIFMTFLATRPGGMDFDPAAAAAYVEARHGLNPWGSIPAPWSVRIDHDYPTPDAMRATRGSGKDGIPGVIIRIFNRNDYLSGLRQDPRDVLGRTLTGPDGRWTDNIYLIPGDYVILYEEAARFPVADLLTVIGPVPGREPPDLPPGDFNSPYYELDYYLSISHGWGPWGPGQSRGPSPVDHHFGGVDKYTFTRNGKGLDDVMVEIYPEADFLAGRTGDRYRAGWSRTNAAGRWDWPVNLYPGRYSAIGWRDGVATQFVIEVP